MDSPRSSCFAAETRRFSLVCALTLVFVLAGAFVSLTAQAADEECPRPVTESSRIWILNTRGRFSGYCGDDCKLDEVQVVETDVDEASRPVSIQQLVKRFSPKRPLLFYVHGNRIAASQALYRGRLVQRLVAQERKPSFDLVIWSWPSRRIRRPLSDVREKAARTEREACLLAKFLLQVDQRVRLRLIGYSFGARIITDALHRLHKREKRQKRNIRGVMMAAAVNHDWLEPGREHAGAMHQFKHLLLFVNPCDPALKRYRFVSGRGKALGFVGLPSDTSLGELTRRVTTEYVNEVVGRSHSFIKYVNSPSIANSIRSHVLAP